MRNRKTIMSLGLLAAVLFLAIGYATMTNVNFAISSTASAEVDEGVFRVAFDKKDGKTTTSNTGTTATVTAKVTGDQSAEFAVTGLKNQNETVSATYTIKNSSDSLNAELSKPIVTLSGDNIDFFEVTAVYGNGSEETPILEYDNSITLTVTVKLKRTPTDSENDVKPATISISYSATPVQPDTPNSSGTSSVRLPETEDPLYYGKHYEYFIDGEHGSLVVHEDGTLDLFEECFLILSFPKEYIRIEGQQIFLVDQVAVLISSDKKKLTTNTGVEYILNGNDTCVRTPTQYDDLPMMLEAEYINSVLNYENGISENKIKTITLGTTINVPEGVTSFDLSIGQNGKVIGYVMPNAGNSEYYDLHIQGDGALYAPENSRNLFSYGNLNQLNNLNLLNTKYVKNMSYMFSNVDLTSIDLSNFDTSKVTNMSYMFNYTENLISLDLSSFDTSNVTNMQEMFYKTGYNSTEFTLNLGNNFNTSKVTDMSSMFEYTGYTSTEFTLNLGDNFDTSNVTYMNSMFYQTGHTSTKFTLDCSNLNVDKVTNYSFFNYGVEDKVIPPIWK